MRSSIPTPLHASPEQQHYPQSIFGTAAVWIKNNDVTKEHIPNNDVSPTQTLTLDSSHGIKGLGRVPLKELTPDMFDSDKILQKDFLKRRLIMQRAKNLKTRKNHRKSTVGSLPLQEQSYLRGDEWWKSYLSPNPSRLYPRPWYNYNGKI